MQSFRAQFRRFRRARRMSQLQLARVLDISLRFVKYIEAGQKEPGLDTAERFKALVERHRKADELLKGRFKYGG